MPRANASHGATSLGTECWRGWVSSRGDVCVNKSPQRRHPTLRARSLCQFLAAQRDAEAAKPRSKRVPMRNHPKHLQGMRFSAYGCYETHVSMSWVTARGAWGCWASAFSFLTYLCSCDTLIQAAGLGGRRLGHYQAPNPCSNYAFCCIVTVAVQKSAQKKRKILLSPLNLMLN